MVALLLLLLLVDRGAYASLSSIPLPAATVASFLLPPAQNVLLEYSGATRDCLETSPPPP